MSPSGSPTGTVSARGHARPVRLGSLKDVRVTPQCGVDDNRSRHPAAREPGLTRTPADTTHGRFYPRLRSLSMPIFPNVLEKDLAGMEYVTLYDQVYVARLLKGHGVSHIPWRPLSAS